MSTEVTFSGPFFDGQMAAEWPRAMEDVADRVSGQALSNVMTNLNSSIRHPTPYYETQIHAERIGATERSVNDRGVIYGHWLEGDGSRNSPVTRFPGYASFRRAKQTLEGQTEGIAEAVMGPHVARWNT
jgi:hypothetical protein